MKDIARADGWKVPRNDEEYDREWPSQSYLSSVGGHVAGSEGSVGFCTLSHPKRWMLASEEPLDSSKDSPYADRGISLGL